MALRPRRQVAPLVVLLRVLRVAATSMMRGPPGVALLREAQPSSAGAHQAPAARRAAAASNVAVHAEMIKAGPRARPSPRGVHGWGGAGRGWMGVMELGWRYARTKCLFFSLVA